MMKQRMKVLLVAVMMLACALSALACEPAPEENPQVNYYKGGETFDFGKWQGNASVYTVNQTENGYSIPYSKIAPTSATQSLIAEVEGDLSGFYYVNFTVSGTPDKEIMLRLGTEEVAQSLINEVRFFTDTEERTYSFKMKNRLALAGLSTIFLWFEPNASGLDVRGTIDISRAWFSKTAPENAETQEESKSYKFMRGSSWSSYGGWYLDTSWTGLSLLPAPGKTTKIYTTRDANDYASFMRPVNLKPTDKKFTMTFDNVRNTVSDISMILRGAEKTQMTDYWLYWESAPLYWTNTTEGSETNSVTIEFDLTAAMAAIGSHLDEDGYVIVVFTDTFGNHPNASTRTDKQYELVIKSSQITA